MSRSSGIGMRRTALVGALLGLATVLPGCGTDNGVSSSVGVSYGYGGYYGPGYYGGAYYPYPPVIVDGPDEWPDRPDRPERPTTLPADVSGRTATAPARPASSSRPVSRPSPRPAPRPMPRGGRR